MDNQEIFFKKNGSNDDNVNNKDENNWVSFNITSFNLNLFKTGGSKEEKKNINTSLF